jgi:poly-beta-1,6-N-acetyl-D-glucosamine synthase
MQSGFINDTGIVLGIGQYNSRPGLLNLLVRYETFMIALQYLGFALAGIPYMGVGRNLAYRKSLFMREKGFISHYRIPSGDDDLFVNRAAPKTTINIRIHPEAHTFSRPVNSFSRYIIQKRRHLSTAKYYKPKHKSLLALFSLTQVMIYASLIAGFVMQQFILLTAIIFLIKWINQLLLIKKISEKLRIKILYVLSPLLELTLLMILLMVWIINLFSKPGKWK